VNAILYVRQRDPNSGEGFECKAKVRTGVLLSLEERGAISLPEPMAGLG
jgi:hypothetical protein